MNNDNNYFNIFSYIASKLEEETQANDCAIICMNEDSAKEPYIEITYIDKEGNETGLTTNFENLEHMVDYASEYEEVFEVFDDDAVMSVVYDSKNNMLNLIRLKNCEYTGNKFFYDYESSIFVGYIINKSCNLSYEEKIKKLYKIMKKIMENVYDLDYNEYFTFKIKDEVINNIYTIKSWKMGYDTNENVEVSEQNNLKTIESIFDINLNDKENIKKM